MKNNKGMLLGVALALCLLFFSSGRADAIVYDFQGTCTGVCTGTAYAEFLLDDSYVPGTTLHCFAGDPATCPVLRYHYVDSTGIEDFDYTIFTPALQRWEPQGAITFPVQSGPGFAAFGLFGGTHFDFPFNTSVDGAWLAWTEYGEQTQQRSQGINGFYTLASHAFTPEPSTAYLLPLAGLVFAARRRKSCKH